MQGTVKKSSNQPERSTGTGKQCNASGSYDVVNLYPFATRHALRAAMKRLRFRSQTNALHLSIFSLVFFASLLWTSRRIFYSTSSTTNNFRTHGDSFFVEFTNDNAISSSPPSLEQSAVQTPLLPRILILTPVKNAGAHLSRFFELLRNTSYPPSLLSLGVLDSDSDDRPDQRTLMALGNEQIAAAAAGGVGLSGTLATLLVEGSRLVAENGWRRVAIARHNFGYALARDARHGIEVQAERRAILARSRNHLLSLALRDEDWVLWLDVDLQWYPSDAIERLLKGATIAAADTATTTTTTTTSGTTKKKVPLRRIIVPNVVMKLGGGRSYDLNSWRGAAPSPGDTATVAETIAALEASGKGAKTVGSASHLELQGYTQTGVRYLQHFKIKHPKSNVNRSKSIIWLDAETTTQDAVVRLDAVGGAFLLVHAELHRFGLIFPPFNYRSRIETEGLSMMALDMGVLSWGMPFLEVLHK